MMLSTSGNPIRVQGHRGSRGTHFENTIPSVLEALDAGASGIEIDLRVTKDHRVVVYHDFLIHSTLVSRIDGAFFPEQAVVETDLSELKKLGYGFSKHPKFPDQTGAAGTPIPLLEELFAALQKDKRAKSFQINLELKREIEHLEKEIEPALFADLVISLVKRYGFENRVYYSSFDLQLLKELRIKDPQATLGYIVTSEDFKWPLSVDQAKEVGASILSPHDSALDKNVVKALQKEGFKVVPWTVNDPERWKELIEMGIDEIITDYPRKLVEFLNLF